MKDDKGQVSGLFFVFFSIFIISLAYITTSPLMDTLVEYNNDQITAGKPVSQLRIDSITMVSNSFYAYPVIIVFVLVTYIIVNSLKSQSGRAF